MSESAGPNAPSPRQWSRTAVMPTRRSPSSRDPFPSRFPAALILSRIPSQRHPPIVRSCVLRLSYRRTMSSILFARRTRRCRVCVPCARCTLETWNFVPVPSARLSGTESSGCQRRGRLFPGTRIATDFQNRRRAACRSPSSERSISSQRPASSAFAHFLEGNCFYVRSDRGRSSAERSRDNSRSACSMCLRLSFDISCRFRHRPRRLPCPSPCPRVCFDPICCPRTETGFHTSAQLAPIFLDHRGRSDDPRILCASSRKNPAWMRKRLTADRRFSVCTLCQQDRRTKF